MKLFCGIIKTTLVIAVIGGGAALIGTAVLGQERVHDLFHTVKGDIHDSVDEIINDRHVLEARVEEVRETYPKEIAKLRSQIRDAEEAHAETERGLTACETVLDLAQEDAAAISFAVSDQAEEGTIKFNGRLYQAGDAHDLLRKTEEVSEEYRDRYNRLADERDLLSQQIELMKEEVNTLKAEWEGFEREYQAIQRQLDQIERNEQVIELAKKRTYSRPSAERKNLTSLKAIQDRIEEVRMGQEEELRVIRQSGPDASYEARAKARMANDRP